MELTNIATLPITLYPAMKIGQVSFMRMTTPADQPYGAGATGSKYQGQRGPTPSRYFENFRGLSRFTQPPGSAAAAYWPATGTVSLGGRAGRRAVARGLRSPASIASSRWMEMSATLTWSSSTPAAFTPSSSMM